MSILFGASCVVAIIFMVTFMFIGIWLFITALKAYRQLKYKNYILEKIYQKLDFLSQNQSNYVTDDKADLIPSDFMDFFGVENEDSSNIDNIKDFDRKDKTSGL
ncbi:MAG: hypothetical protein E6423_14810 [Clostridium sp.]|uniref:hypothetical protein n=1 Tax=Clostridium paraputrificum TaxID=29363 RepID=UPI00189E780E|nr:hypothetical protein [Clostridium paraputrificum]MDB2092597.1 hypothetical protein [Clostridium paraputrificum]MDU6810028.1 hypothetical protein [Clostridium sp.]